MERQESDRRLLLFGSLAALGIFLLLVTSFRSSRASPCSRSSRLPWRSSAVCSRRTCSATSIISLGSLVGFFTILGIVARNGIMQISHFQHLETRGGRAFGPDLVLRGARERVTPILMTALTTGLALVPLLLTGNIPGQEIEHPMAIVIVGGLVASTILNLFVVPVAVPALRPPAEGSATARPHPGVSSLRATAAGG